MTWRLRATHTLVLATFTVVLFTTNTTPSVNKQTNKPVRPVRLRIHCGIKWKRMTCLLKARKNNTLRMVLHEVFS